ncbi:hypothetical protein Tco_1238664 [Tanacetum coccineum]
MKQGDHAYVEAAVMAISTCLREPVGENSCTEVVPYRWLLKAKETKSILRIEELLSVLMENKERKTKNLSVTFDDVEGVDATKAELLEICRFGRNVGDGNMGTGMLPVPYAWVAFVNYMKLQVKNEVVVVTGHVIAIPCTKKSAGLRVDDIDLFEINKIKDCDFYDQKSPEPRVKNMVNTGERVVKPVWDYGKKVNHQNFLKHLKYPHAKRTFNPSAILTRAGLVNTDRSNVSTARSINTVRPVYTVRPVSTARPLASKIAESNSVIRPNHPRLDIVRPKASNSPIKRSYFTQPVYRPKDLKPDVKTFGVKNMTTVGTRAVVSKGKVENVLKKAKWVWRPKMNYQDHVYKYNGSYMLKKFEAIQRSCYRIMQWWIVVALAI